MKGLKFTFLGISALSLGAFLYKGNSACLFFCLVFVIITLALEIVDDKKRKRKKK